MFILEFKIGEKLHHLMTADEETGRTTQDALCKLHRVTIKLFKWKVLIREVRLKETQAVYACD